MLRLCTLLLCCLPLSPVLAGELLIADYRPRPPEMFEVDGQPSGPLVSILETAARRVGATVQWRKTPFIRSLEDLKSGRVDLVPRVLFSRERVAYVHYLPPSARSARPSCSSSAPARKARSGAMPISTAARSAPNAALSISRNSTRTRRSESR